MIPERNPAPGYVRHPDHEVRISPFKGTVRVAFEGRQIAESSRAILVDETNHVPVYYLSSRDVDHDFLVASHHTTSCPFKGTARYWNVKVGYHEIANAVWSYELPYDEALELAGLLAFYPKKVTIEAMATQ